MEKHDELPFNILKNVSFLYEGCGNRLLIVHLPHEFHRDDESLRRSLTRLGNEHRADSVLVITGNPSHALSQGYHVTMDVFEPRGNDIVNPQLPGSWSTMCGNGVRAVTRYLIDKGLLSCVIQTRSGRRTVSVLSDNQFRVCMGEFTTSVRDLRPYVVRRDFNRLISLFHDIEAETIIAGLNGNRENGVIDGEPHFVLFLKYNHISSNRLERLCEALGRRITTNREYFPQDINTSLVVMRNSKNGTQAVDACTFERGVEYVTRSCGTAATVIGSHLLSTKPMLRAVSVRMPGGTLVIESDDNNRYYMTGPANPVS